MTTLRSELPDLKKWWDGLSDVYSKVIQTVVERLFNNHSSLSALKQNGYGVGMLKWKPPREFRSFTGGTRRIPRPLRSGRKPTLDETYHARWQGRLPTHT